jgi:hypothetical protein
VIRPSPPSGPTGTVRPLWSQPIAAVPCGLALAREKGWLLVWDDQHRLHLFNQAGQLQGMFRLPGALAAACAADDGSFFAAVGAHGEVWWLAPDLTLCWQHNLDEPALAAALDPFGQYLAVADARGRLHLLDRGGKRRFQEQAARPLRHLAFVPAAPFVVGCADFGLVACLDLGGHWVWQDGLVAHVGSLAVNGDGSRIILPCFTEGLRCYAVASRQSERLTTTEPCRLAALSFEGRRILAADLTNRLLVLDRGGQPLMSYPLDQPVVSLALGALGDRAAVALPNGVVMMLEV